MALSDLRLDGVLEPEEDVTQGDQEVRSLMERAVFLRAAPKGLAAPKRRRIKGVAGNTTVVKRRRVTSHKTSIMEYLSRPNAG